MPDIDIIVAGAGIVGTSTALWLQMRGHKVMLIDPNILIDATCCQPHATCCKRHQIVHTPSMYSTYMNTISY